MGFNLKFGDVEVRCGAVYDHRGKLLPMTMMEECGELIQAVSKIEGSNYDIPQEEKLKLKQNVIDEMCDVLICMSALSHRYSISEDDILKRLDKKLKEQSDVYFLQKTNI